MTLREKIARVIASDFARQEGVDAELHHVPDDGGVARVDRRVSLAPGVEHDEAVECVKHADRGDEQESLKKHFFGL